MAFFSLNLYVSGVRIFEPLALVLFKPDHVLFDGFPCAIAVVHQGLSRSVMETLVSGQTMLGAAPMIGPHDQKADGVLLIESGCGLWATDIAYLS